MHLGSFSHVVGGSETQTAEEVGGGGLRQEAGLRVIVS